MGQKIEENQAEDSLLEFFFRHCSASNMCMEKNYVNFCAHNCTFFLVAMSFFKCGTHSVERKSL